MQVEADYISFPLDSKLLANLLAKRRWLYILIEYLKSSSVIRSMKVEAWCTWGMLMGFEMVQEDGEVIPREYLTWIFKALKEASWKIFAKL